MNYTNYAGHKQDLSTIDHAHLSNIYWFNMICNNANGRQLKFIMDENENRSYKKHYVYERHSRKPYNAVEPIILK